VELQGAEWILAGAKTQGWTTWSILAATANNELGDEFFFLVRVDVKTRHGEYQERAGEVIETSE